MCIGRDYSCLVIARYLPRILAAHISNSPNPKAKELFWSVLGRQPRDVRTSG